MTVIASDGILVSADTLMCSQGNRFPNSANKIFPVFKANYPTQKTFVLSFSGDIRYRNAVYSWWMQGKNNNDIFDWKEYPLADFNTEGMLIVFSYNNPPVKFTAGALSCYSVPRIFAHGTGADHAYALMVGAKFTAAQAVSSACLYVEGCGGPHEVFDMSANTWYKQSGDYIIDPLLSKILADNGWNTI